LATTWPVVTETCHLLSVRIGAQAQQSFVRSLRQGAAEMAPPNADDLPRIEALMAKYADLPMDLAEASLMILAERLGHGRILSTDERDFRTDRWKRQAPFENLLAI